MQLYPENNHLEGVNTQPAPFLSIFIKRGGINPTATKSGEQNC